MKDQKALETGTLIGQFTDSIEYKVNDFLSDGVVTTSVVVGYARDQSVPSIEISARSSYPHRPCR